MIGRGSYDESVGEMIAGADRDEAGTRADCEHRRVELVDGCFECLDCGDWGPA